MGFVFFLAGQCEILNIFFFNEIMNLTRINLDFCIFFLLYNKMQQVDLFFDF